MDLLIHNSCHGLWDSTTARFTPCAIPLLSCIPLATIFIIYVSYFCARFLSSWKPKWMKPFVKPYVSAPFALQKSTISWPSVASACLSLLGAVAHLLLLMTREKRVESTLLSISWSAVTVFFLGFKPVRCPTSLSAYYGSVIIYDLAILTNLDSVPILVGLSLCCSIFGVVVLLLMPACPPSYDDQNIGRVGAAASSKFRSPEDNLRLWQFLSVSWLSPLIALGKTRQINESDVWTLPLSFQHGRLLEKMLLMHGSLLLRVIRANAIDIALLSLLSSVDMICDFATPLLLQQLLKAMESLSSSVRIPMTYATLIFAARVLQVQIAVIMLWYGRRCYERCRGEMIMMVYDKALRRKNVIGIPTKAVLQESIGTDISRKKKNTLLSRIYMLWKQASVDPPKPATMGKVLNLVRGDVYEVAQRFWEVDKIWTVPIRTVASVWVIWSLLGPSCFIAVLVVVLGQCFSAIIARLLVVWSRKYKAAKDTRLQITSQYIEVIRHLRWYNWQDHWLSQVLDARKFELRILVQTKLWSVLMGSVNNMAGFFFPVVALGSYALLGENKLSVDVIFPALTLFNIMSQQIEQIPGLVNDLANAFVSAKRLDDFMNEPEKEKSRYSDTATTKIQLVNCTFAWPETSTAVLKNITLNFSPGLTVIYGTVGSGKTALLQALMGELDELDGTRLLPDVSIGYCAQTPWLQSMSIRDNILFHSQFDEARYRQTLNACELLPDLENFRHGDKSFIGENGIGLSGGQKSRVALARAVYSKAELLLLDDPLSSLDHNTAENIVHKLFSGPLVSGRTVILTTHRVGLVQHLADDIIEVRDGYARTLDGGQLSRLRFQTRSEDSENVTEVDEDFKGEVNGKPKHFLEEEHRAEWGVQAKVYWTYVKAGKLKWWFSVAVMLGLYRFVLIYRTWFLKTWGEAYPHGAINFAWILGSKEVSEAFPRLLLPSDPLAGLPSPIQNVVPWLAVFAVIAALMQLFLTLQNLAEIITTYCAGRSIFRDVMLHVTNSTFRFYDVTPVGRLMNRLTSDISTVDSTITSNIVLIIVYFIAWVSAVVVIASVTPAFLVCSIALVFMMVAVFLHFLPLSQNLRRLEMTSLSPLFANFGELLHGLTTVRAFRAEKRFQERITSVVDTFQGMDHFFWSLQAWLTHRCRNLSGLSEFALTLLAFYSNLSPGLTAFMLIAAEQFVTATFGLCSKYGTLQMEFISVERVHELLHIDQEPDGTQPPASWPRFGTNIDFREVTIRYASHFDPALSKISLTIPGGSTTAVLGRTGSGKSTLASALLNVVRPESGQIIIDGIDISSVDPKTLRSRVTFIPQDPALFSGSIRHNLDPRNDFSDADSDIALQRVCGRHGWSLDTHVESGGKNLSHGQRQLICIARAVLRRSSIVILDEATASIDFEGSMEIQGILREEMKSATVITIAHRVEAVRDADYCVVLENGKVKSQGYTADFPE